MVLQPDLPACKYSVFADGPDGSEIASLNLGDLMYHSWSCSYHKGDFYCMQIHTCTADDGQGTMQTIVDRNGYCL
ncbi:unnamed protein product [Toxocara canis]|uniref:ZP domain-containing protein n=1 Tax=Toxocara canis TaxID=6265 RepID=A0A183U6Y8_TOXCA|nr:unnamed protein product [Toxocara canis]